MVSKCFSKQKENVLIYFSILVNFYRYFTAIFSIFKPFIDQRTRDKFSILNTDFLPELLELMDISIIPREYGGESDNVPWDLNNPDASGCSKSQIVAYMQTKYTPDNVSTLLTPEEIESLQIATKIGEEIKNGTSFPWNITPSGIPDAPVLNDNIPSNSPSEATNNPPLSLPSVGDNISGRNAPGMELPPRFSSSPATTVPIRARMIKAEVHLFPIITKLIYLDCFNWIFLLLLLRTPTLITLIY